MKAWSSSWKSSKNPSKKRKYQTNAPIHLRRRFMSSHLSKELNEKHSRRAFPLRTGDTVKIMNGDLKGKSGKITKINLKTYKIYIEGINNLRKDGNASPRAIESSNVMITALNLEDQKRSNILKRKQTSENKNEQKTS
jgi:large subunit ribosomal protein L24